MQPTFLFALLFAVSALPAQTTFPVLNDLPGTWYAEGRQLATYSEWHFTDDHTLVNQVYSVKCGRNIPSDYAILQIENASIILSWWTDSLRITSPQVFRLLQTDADALLFQNENPAGKPRQLAWQFSGRGDLLALVDGEETSFHRRAGQPLRTSLNLRLGANVSVLAARTFSSNIWQYRPGSGADLSVALGLHGPGPLAWNFEVGLAQRQIGVSADWRSENVGYTRQGTYHNLDLSLAFVPELGIGKNKHFSLSAGVFATIARKSRFQGTTTALGPNPNLHDPSFGLGYETGVLTALAWQLPKTVLRALRPAIYCRGTWGLGYAKVRSVALGIGLRLK